MDSETLMKFIQSVGVRDYSKAKELAQMRNRTDLIDKLLDDSDVNKNYKSRSDVEKALKDAGLYYKF